MDFNNLEQIAAYFAGMLSEKEAAVFRQKMESDVEFAEEVRLYQLSKAVIRENHREQLLVDADNYLNEFESKPTKVISFRRILSIAAGVLLLTGVGFWWFQNSSNSSPEKLFAQHFELPKAPGVRGTVEAEMLIKSGYEKYSSGNFDIAVEQLNQAIEKGTNTTTAPVYFYLGLSHLKLENFAEAAAAFQKINPESSYQQQAIWYEALTYLKSENIQTTRIKLEAIINQNGHYKKSEAEQLLKALEN